MELLSQLWSGSALKLSALRLSFEAPSSALELSGSALKLSAQLWSRQSSSGALSSALVLSVQLWRPQLSCGAPSSALGLSAYRHRAAPTVDSRLETLPLPSTPPSGIPHAARDEPRLSLVDCFVTVR